MLGDFSCRIALQLLGYVYPAYKTFKVVQLPATRTNDTLLRRWCCYWCLMAVFTAVAPLTDTFFFWIPFYYEAKLALAIYLWANDLAGAQHVWGRWFQPLVASYEPLVDQRIAESKAVAGDWLHSHTLRLAALAQAKVLAWLASVQLQAAEASRAAAGGGGGAGRGSGAEAEEEEAAVLSATQRGATRRGAAAASSAKRASSRGRAGANAEASGKGAEPAVPPFEPLEPRRSSFGLATFFSARSSDLQQADLQQGLKAFPILAQRDELSPERD